MNPNLETAIIHFLANEYHLAPENILPDTDFFTDLNLTQDQFIDLAGRMQDALNFTLPEEKINEIHTLTDLFNSLAPDDLPPHEPI